MQEDLILDKLEGIDKKVTTISQVLLGNGNTDKSVVVRLAILEESDKNERANSRLGKRGQIAIVCSSIAAVTSVVVALIALLK